MDELTKSKPNVKKKFDKDNNFVVIISDFYYFDSAENLRVELNKKIQINEEVHNDIQKNVYNELNDFVYFTENNKELFNYLYINIQSDKVNNINYKNHC